MKNNSIKFIYASGKDPDLFYATAKFFSDPVFLIDFGKRKKLFLDSREFEAFLEENKNSEIETILLDPFLDRALERKEAGSITEKLARLLLEEHDLSQKEILVPDSFPLGLADFLRSKGWKISAQNPFFPQRKNKVAQEVEQIKKVIRKNYLAFDKIQEILKQAQIRADKLIFQNQVLTSEFLKKEVEQVFWQNDLESPEGMIISSASQTALPHHQGSGEIRPHAPIICDIFPRHRTSGYFADMTRTFVKGKPSAQFKKLYDSVQKVQAEVLAQIKPGLKAKSVWEKTAKKFLDLGYHFGSRGFTHGLGHGFGLEIHEPPFANKSSEEILEPGNILTVEPGLYYPKLGGARIEDNVLITDSGAELLTDYSKDLVI